jgi:hypothetical protein
VRSYSAGTAEPKIADIEVTYRPKGCVVFVGETRYDGWTAEVLDKRPDGALLDGKGGPLPDGQPPVYLRFEVYQDADFNEINFGEFVDERQIEPVKRLHFHDVFRSFTESGRFSVSVESKFVASRRVRPLVKIFLSENPSGTGADHITTRIVNINSLTPHLENAVYDEVLNALVGFIEGRYSIKNISNDESVLVQIADCFVDYTTNKDGAGPRFNSLAKYLPESRFDDLAMRLMAIFAIDVSVVDGPEGGLLVRKVQTQAK